MKVCSRLVPNETETSSKPLTDLFEMFVISPENDLYGTVRTICDANPFKTLLNRFPK